MNSITKFTQPLFLAVLVIALMILLKGFLVPLAYGFLIALIVYPVCKMLEIRNVPRSISIALSVILVGVVILFIIFIFVLQIIAINKEVPELSVHLREMFSVFQQWIYSNFGISIFEQNNLIQDVGRNLLNHAGNILSGTFSIAAGTLFYIIIIPVYTVLFLYYRSLLVRFVSSLIGERHRSDLPAIINEAIHVYFNYVKGMLWVYIIVGILNSIGLLLIGVEYAILFGMVTAFMTIIPYVGIIISSALPVVMIWLKTGDIIYPLAVIGVFAAVQYLEANIIFPFIVGKHLGINALASLVAIFAGGVIWGVSGMILFLPFLALLKIVSGHISELKPVNQLLDIPDK